jgi:hypothetical protein
VVRWEERVKKQILFGVAQGRLSAALKDASLSMNKKPGRTKSAS